MKSSPFKRFERAVLLPFGLRIEAEGARATPSAADCLIVPGAWVSETGEPSTTLVRRVEHAIASLALSTSGHVIFTGGPVHGRAVEADAALRVAEERGFDPRRAVLERTSTNTFENLLYSKGLMRERGWKSAIICTDAIHVPRCLWLARDVGLEASASPAIRDLDSGEREQREALASREAIAVVGYFAFWPYFQFTRGR